MICTAPWIWFVCRWDHRTFPILVQCCSYCDMSCATPWPRPVPVPNIVFVFCFWVCRVLLTPFPEMLVNSFFFAPFGTVVSLTPAWNNHLQAWSEKNFLQNQTTITGKGVRICATPIPLLLVAPQPKDKKIRQAWNLTKFQMVYRSGKGDLTNDLKVLCKRTLALHPFLFLFCLMKCGKK